MTVDLIDDVLIVNKALIKIAETPIDSLDNSESKAARTMKLLLPQGKRYVFRLHPWNCLRERAILALSADKPAFGFDYKYALPADCLRPLAIQLDDGTFIPFYDSSYGGSVPGDKQFVVEGKYLLTNTQPHKDNAKGWTGLNLLYIKYPDNLNILDSQLIELLSYYLAVEVAYTFTGSASLKQTLQAEMRDCLKLARANNAQEIAPGIPLGTVVGAHW